MRVITTTGLVIEVVGEDELASALRQLGITGNGKTAQPVPITRAKTRPTRKVSQPRPLTERPMRLLTTLAAHDGQMTDSQLRKALKLKDNRSLFALFSPISRQAHAHGMQFEDVVVKETLPDGGVLFRLTDKVQAIITQKAA